MSGNNISSLIISQLAIERSRRPFEFVLPRADGNAVSNPSLCVKCTGLFEGPIFKFDPVYEHWSLFSLQESQKQDCHLCVLLHQALQNSAQGPVPMVNLTCHVKITRCSPIVNALKIDFIYQDRRPNVNSEPVAQISLRAYPKTDQVALTLRDKSDDRVDGTHSSQCFNQIRSWLSECQYCHKNCNYAGDSTILPTRLIHLGVVDGQPSIKVVESFELFENVTYATLSHRWGISGQSLTLKTENIEQFKRNIPWSSLPRTFQEAAICCKELDVHYLWIDALCIIQGSDSDDWLRESAKMREVYKSSIFNIAAGASEDSSGGLFRNRHPLTTKPLSVFTNWIEDSDTYRVFDYSKFHRDIIKSPLYARGWVTQERFLAPRIILFTADEIYWECNQRTASECFPSSLPVTSAFPSKANMGLTMVSLKSDVEILQTWWKLVKLYSSCELTFARDKLVAFSAIARQTQMRLTSTLDYAPPSYLAGLWLYRLTDNLLWYVLYIQAQHTTQPLEYRAPSWSWAAIDRPVNSLVFDSRPPRVRTKCVCRIIRAVTDAQSDPFGTVKRAYIRAQGLALRAALVMDAPGNDKRRWQLEVEYLVSAAHCRVRLTGIFRLDLSLDLNQYSEVFLFAIQMRYFEINGRLLCAGLILVREVNSKGQYRRIGMFTSVDWAELSRLAEKVPLGNDDYEETRRAVVNGLHCHDDCDIERSLARWQTYVITII